MKNKMLACVLVALVGHAKATEITEDAQKLLDFETAELAARSLPPEVAVFGSVLAPAPLVDLIRQTDTAQAALGISQESLDRAEKLFAAGELVARKDVQAARAQQMVDQAALRALEDRLALEWGPWFAGKSAAERDALAEDLLAGRVGIVRLTVPRDGAAGMNPQAVRLHAFAQDTSIIRSDVIFPALAVDAAFQAPTFLALVKTPETPLPVGLLLEGRLVLPGIPREGFLVPAGAVVFHQGKGLIYQKSGATEFERVEVSLDTAVEGGWFLGGEGEKPNNVVVNGAQAILSQETLGPAEK